MPTFEALPTSLPRVTITATGGNLFIRRGPGLAYDAVGILYKDTSAEIIGRDVLSGWVQVNISDSQATGWISIQTQFSKIDGDLTIIQAFTFEEWPEPAYIKTAPNMICLLSQLGFTSHRFIPMLLARTRSK